MKNSRFLACSLCSLLISSAVADPWTWDTGSGISYVAEKNTDETAYQFRFLTTSGVNYFVQSSDDLATWSNDTFYRGLGYTITHPLFLLPQNDGSNNNAGEVEESIVTINPSLVVKEIPDSSIHTGLLVTWVSLDDETPKNYILYGKTLEDNAPLMYSRNFDEYQFFIQFYGEIFDTSQLPTPDALGVKDAAMIGKLVDSLPAINAEILANTAAQASAPPSPPRTGAKKFYRLHYAYVDSDMDGLQDHIEAQTGTEMWNWDTDGDGLSDGVDPDPLVNNAVADPDGAGLASSLNNGLLARYDFEELQGSYPNQTFEDKSGNNRHASPLGMGVDSLGMVSKAGKTTNGYAKGNGTTFQGVSNYALSFWTCFDKDSLKSSAVGTIQGLYGVYDHNYYVSSNHNHGILEYDLRGLRVTKNVDGSELWKLGGFVYDSDSNKDGFSGPITSTEYETMSFTQPEGSIDDGRWHHITVVREAPYYRIYIDGILKKQESKAVLNLDHTATTAFCFGRWMEHLPNTQFKGKFDRFRIYDRSLAPAEVEALYKQDIDNDGLWDITENATRIWRDKNSDGYETLDEMNYFISPYRFNSESEDFDEDDLSSVQEQDEGTNIVIADSDGDGMPDGWEVLYGLDPTDPTDALLDKEGDGLSNLLEYYNASNPNLANTDGDSKNDFDEYTQGSLPGDASDGGNVIPEEEALTINLGVGDKSGSDSENYDMKVYKIDPLTGEENYYFTHPSGGNGQYDNKAYSKFRKNETYTFQIFWKGTNLNRETAINPDGADFDYTFEVEPQGDDNGYIVDQYDLEIKRADSDKPILGDKSDIDTFKQTVQKKRVLRGNAELITDYNRDGKIDYLDKGKITENNPWHWWINDDKDDGFMGGGGVDVPGQTNSNGQDDEVNGMSDLIDFFPLYLNIEEALKVMPKENHQYKLKHAEGALKFAKNLELVPDGKPDVNGAGAFWRSTSRGIANANLSVETISSSGITLDASVLKAFESGKGILLVEAIKSTDQPLILEIWKGAEKKAAIEFALSISGVEEMFRHVNLCDTVGSTVSVQSRIGQPSNYPDSLTNDRAYVYVHGYNPKDSVSGNQNYQRGFHAKGFKKLHQLGSNAKFVGLTWDGATGPDYHKAAYNAFKTSVVLKEELNFLGTNKIVVAGHSLGNLLVSNAISHEGFRPDSYFLINAAAPVEAYHSGQTTGEGGVAMRPNMTEKSWDDYDNRFHSASWHENFPINDKRHDLKWKGRFDSVATLTNAYNFYSTGEEVVANPEPNNRDVNILRTVWNGVVLNQTLGRYAWVTQEFLKGGTSVAGFAFERNHGGWKLIPSTGNVSNPVYRFMGETDPSLPITQKNRYLPAAANTALSNGTITNEHLAQFGYFWRFELAFEALYAPINDSNRVWHEIPGNANFDWTNPHTQAQGSDKAGEINTQWVILSTAMPSISFAAAANNVTNMAGSNMMSLKSGWPDFSERNPDYKNDWQHSDFWLIAPSYVKPMYEKQITKGLLKQ